MEKKNKNITPIDFTTLLADYSKKWVVLTFSEDAVLKSGDSYEEIVDYSNKGIVLLVPDFSVPLVP